MLYSFCAQDSPSWVLELTFSFSYVVNTHHLMDGGFISLNGWGIYDNLRPSVRLTQVIFMVVRTRVSSVGSVEGCCFVHA